MTITRRSASGALLLAALACNPAPGPTTARPRSPPLLDARPHLTPPPARPAPPSVAGDSEPGPTTPESFTACYARFVPGDQPVAALARLTRACGPLGGMRPLTPVTVGRQTFADPPARYALDVPPGGGCYRIFATASASVGDLDLLVRDSERPLAGDLGSDAWPVLPPRGPLCLATEGLYLLEVSVREGAGDYALQIWGTR